MLLTVAEVKTYLNITTVDATRDTYITNEVIPAGQSHLDGYLNRTLESAERTEYVDYSNTQRVVENRIHLIHYPITAVSTLKYYDSDKALTELFTGSDDVSNSVLIEHKSIKVFKSYYLGEKVLQVVYTAGYTTATLPAILKQALKKICAYNYRDGYYGGQSTLMLESKSSGGTGVTDSETFKKLDLSECDKYINHG